MRIAILLTVLVPLSFAVKCGNLNSCYECDSSVSPDGNQGCSWCSTQSKCVPSSGLECIFGTRINNKDDCPVGIPDFYTYNETLSKKTLLISYSSYGDSARICLDTNPMTTDITVTKQVVVVCDNTGKDTCSGFAGYSALEKAIIVAFRGTIGNEQLFLEAEYMLFKKKAPVAGGGAVSEYFYEGFVAVWDGGIAEELQRLRILFPTYDLWVTGHSMGAALATVAANVIAATNAFPADRMKVMTYGEPRVGDREFVASHDKLLPYKYRVTHRQDIVTHIPPKNFLGYRHHRYEVWYNNDMNEGDPYILCLAPEDNACSDQNLIDLSWPDHTHYYGHFVDAYKGTGCQSF